jgi:hypothetical protein
MRDRPRRSGRDQPLRTTQHPQQPPVVVAALVCHLWGELSFASRGYCCGHIEVKIPLGAWRGRRTPGTPAGGKHKA